MVESQKLKEKSHKIKKNCRFTYKLPIFLIQSKVINGKKKKIPNTKFTQ